MQNAGASYENIIRGATSARLKFKELGDNEIEWSFLDDTKLPTLAFEAGSVLRDAGTPAIAAVIHADARGFPRCDLNSYIPDIGAYEFVSMLSTIILLR